MEALTNNTESNEAVEALKVDIEKLQAFHGEDLFGSDATEVLELSRSVHERIDAMSLADLRETGLGGFVHPSQIYGGMSDDMRPRSEFA